MQCRNWRKKPICITGFENDLVWHFGRQIIASLPAETIRLNQSSAAAHQQKQYRRQQARIDQQEQLDHESTSPKGTPDSHRLRLKMGLL